MEKVKVFRLSFLALVVINFFNIAEQMLGKFVDWVFLLLLKFHRNMNGFPLVEIDGGIVALILLAFLIFLIFAATLVFLESRGSITLALIITCFDLIYGIGHLTIGIHWRTYFPGTITATLMILFSSLVLYFYYLMKHPLNKEDEESTEITETT